MTPHSTNSSRSVVWLAAPIVASLALGTSCRKAKGPSTPTAEGLVTQVLTEDAAAMGVCSALQLAPGPAAPALSQPAVAELSLEVQADFSTLLRTLSVAQGMQRDEQLSCDPAALARQTLRDAGIAVEGGGRGDEQKAEGCLTALSEAAVLTVQLAEAAEATAEELGGVGEGLDAAAVASALRERAPQVVAGWAKACSADDAACVPGKVLEYAGAGDSGITPRALRRLQASAHLVEGLGLAQLDLEQLRAEPGRLLRNVDFSFIVLVKMVELGELTERTIDDVTSSLGWVGGIVRTLMKAVAAEIVASVNERVFTLMENRGLVSRTSVARRACGLWQNGDSRPVVASRMLKRTILRLSADEPANTLGQVCRESVANRRSCAKVARRLGGSVADAERKPELAPWPEPQVQQVQQQAARGALAAEGEPRGTGRSLADKSELMLAAADACRRSDRADPACVTDLGSLGLFYLFADEAEGEGKDQGEGSEGDGGQGSTPPPTTPPSFDALTTAMGTMQGSLEGLERKLGVIDGKVDQLAYEVARLELRLEQFDGHQVEIRDETTVELHQLELGIRALLLRDTKSACSKHIRRVWANRYEYLRGRVGADPLAEQLKLRSPDAARELCNSKQPSGQLQAQSGGLDLSISAADFCDVRKPFHLGTLRTESLFGSCGVNLEPAASDAALGAVEQAILGAVARAEGDVTVVVHGHTDQVPVHRCRVRMPDGETRVIKGARGNEELSLERARAFERALMERGTLPSNVRIEPRGLGARELSQDCGSKSSKRKNDPCHAQNRRVTVAIDTDAFTMDYLSCLE